jgi:hypothetical protein
VLFTKYYYSDNINEDEMGGKVAPKGRREMRNKFLLEIVKGTGLSEGLGLDGGNVRKDIVWSGLGCIYLIQISIGDGFC